MKFLKSLFPLLNIAKFIVTGTVSKVSLEMVYLLTS